MFESVWFRRWRYGNKWYCPSKIKSLFKRYFGRQHPCDITECRKSAYADARWLIQGQVQVASLCKEHMHELWGKLNPLLKDNMTAFSIDKPGKLKRQK